MKLIFNRRDLLEEEIVTLKEEIRLIADPTSERYEKTVAMLKELEEIKNGSEKQLVKDWAPVISSVITVAGSATIVAFITLFEEKSAFTTAAKMFIPRFK